MADELSRWLRRVRPSTAADDDWANSGEADSILASIHRETGGMRRARVRRIQPAHWLPAAAIAGVAAAVVAVSVSSTPTPPPVDHGFAGPGGSNAIALPRTVIRPASFLLNTETSCDGLLAKLRSHAAANIVSLGQGVFGGVSYVGGFYRGAPLSAAVPVTAANGAPVISARGQASYPDTSGTNVQETGVDEPDVVKTDGDRVITLTDGVLRVIDTTTRTVTGTLDLTAYNGWQGAQLLVDGAHALVTLGSFDPSSQSTYLFVDLDGQPSVTGSMRASGFFVDARMIGSKVRLVVRSSPTINLPSPYYGSAAAKSADQKAVREAPLSAWLPKYSVSSGSGHTSKTVPCTRTSHPADFTGTSMLTIYTLDMTSLGDDPAPVTIAADGDTVYANSSSLYVASNPQWFCCSLNTKQNTEVHRFDITGTGSPQYLGSAVVPGRLLSSYSLSDSDGYLRIATTTDDWTGHTLHRSNGIYVLADDTLEISGHVDGLGAGEQIYAVRFLGPLAYVVTYRQTDPLYVVDLHDPTAPKVTGSLTISGVSSYLHDLGGGHLLGVGQSVSNSEGAGVQVSLFDVSSAPKRIGNIVVPKTPGEPGFDPHTFLYWQPTGLVVVPLHGWAGSNIGKVFVGRVSGDRISQVGLLANPRPTEVRDDGLGIQRSLIVNGDLWTVSGGGVQVSQQSDLHRIAWIPYTA